MIVVGNDLRKKATSGTMPRFSEKADHKALAELQGTWRGMK